MIKQKDHVKYLGILLDEHLNWKYQIKNIALKTSRGIGMLAKLRPFLKDKLLRSIYYSLVYSHLSYGIHAWGSADPTSLHKLNILNNKAVRIMCNKQYFQIYGEIPGPLPSSEPLYKKLEILKLDDVFNLNIANFVYSTLDFESPQVFHDWFKFDHEVHSHSTRLGTEVLTDNHFDVGITEPTLTLHTKGSNNDYGRKRIQALGPIIWNKIPIEIQKSTSRHTFKINLKKILLEKYIS